MIYLSHLYSFRESAVKKICVIPARGGSKRIPKKNIIDFFGKPLIAWTIESAIRSDLFDDIIVSTDSDEIGNISKSFGAKVFKRVDFADDVTPVSEATINTVTNLNYSNRDIIYQLMANCPLRTEHDILSATEYFDGLETFDSLISCFKFGWMNPWWALKKIDGKYSPLFEISRNIRSQDLEELFCPTGSIWISTLDSLLKQNSYYTGNHTYFNIPMMSAMDIDDVDDLNMAKAFFLMKNKKLDLKIEKN